MKGSVAGIENGRFYLQGIASSQGISPVDTMSATVRPNVSWRAREDYSGHPAPRPSGRRFATFGLAPARPSNLKRFEVSPRHWSKKNGPQGAVFLALARPRGLLGTSCPSPFGPPLARRSAALLRRSSNLKRFELTPGHKDTKKARKGPVLCPGAPERIRTSDLCLRRAALYPAELRARILGGRSLPDRGRRR